MTKPIAERDKYLTGQVHCPICTHTVPANMETAGKRVRVVPGQRCARCSASLDVAVIVQLPEAA
jgi:hypothetical protein